MLLLPVHLGRETSCPHCSERFAVPEDAGPRPAEARTSCPHCTQPIVLRSIHEGHETECPHCGEAFVVQKGAIDRLRAPSKASQTAYVFGIVAIVGMGVTWLCCSPAVLLVGALGPIGWFLAHKDRKAAIAAGQKPEPNTDRALLLCRIATVLMAVLIAWNVFMIVAMSTGGW